MPGIQRYANGCFQQPDTTSIGSGSQIGSEFVTMEVTGAESLLGFNPREAFDDMDDYEE